MSEVIANLDDLSVGLTPDLPDQKPQLWRDGRNILFVDQSLQPLPGQIPLADLRVQANSLSVIGDYIFIGSGGSCFLFNVSSSELYDVTPIGLIQQGVWSFASFGTWMVASHAGKLFIWKPEDWDGLTGNPPLFYEIADAPAKPINFILKVKNFILAIADDEVYSSEDDNPELWTPEQDNMANSLFIRDLTGRLIGGVALADFALLCTPHEVIKFSYIGRPYIWGYKKIFEGVGIWNHKSIILTNKSVFAFGPSGIWATDGTGFVHIDQETVGSEINELINLNRLDSCFAASWNNLQHVFFFIPTLDGITRCYAFNMNNNKWTVLDWNRYASFQQYWVDTNSVLFLDDLKSASNISDNFGKLFLPEQADGNIGYGFDNYGEVRYGGVLWFQV